MKEQQLISRQVNVGNMERGLSLAGGLALLAYVLTHRTRIGLPLGLDAGYLIYRGATGHCVVYEAMGINRAKKSLETRLAEQHIQDIERAVLNHEHMRDLEDEDVVEMSSEDSFPASDPPGWVSSKRKLEEPVKP